MNGAGDRPEDAGDEPMADSSALYAALLARLDPEGRRLLEDYESARGDAMVDEYWGHAAELARHFPGQAPAIRLAWAHVTEQNLAERGVCCADDDAGAPEAAS